MFASTLADDLDQTLKGKKFHVSCINHIEMALTWPFKHSQKPSPDSREDAEVEINPPGDGKVEDDDEILVADYTSDQETEDGGSDEEEDKVNTDEDELTKVILLKGGKK